MVRAPKERPGVDVAIPTEGEAKNGWTPQSLTDYLRKSAGSEFEYRQEMLARARERMDRAAKAVFDFKRDEDLTGPDAGERLETLLAELDEARATHEACAAKL